MTVLSAKRSWKNVLWNSEIGKDVE